MRLSRLLYSLFILVIGLLTFLRPDLSFREDAISDFLVGPYHWLATLSFIVLSLGSLWCIRQRSPRSSVAFRGLIGIYSLAVFVVGWTIPGQILHNISAGVSFAIIPITACMLAQRRSRREFLWPGAIILSMLLWPVFHFGLGERITVLLEVAWLFRLTYDQK